MRAQLTPPASYERPSAPTLARSSSAPPRATVTMRIPVEEPRPLVTAPATPLRFHDLERARAAHGHRADILAPAMLRADPLADAAVESFTQLPAGRGVAMLNAALAHGIDSVTDAPESLIALFRAVDEVPMWVDWDELAVGGDALMRTGMLGLLTLMCYSLPMAYAVAEGNKPLTFSGRLMGRAARRLNETGRFVIETCRPGGLRRDGDGFRITIKVRLMHAQVRRLLLQSARWKTESWGTPINQADMAATNVTFSAVVLRGLRRLGVRFSARESAAVMSLWRYSGHLSGVEPDLLCATEGEGVRLAELMWMTRRAADDDSRQLVQALMACKLEPPLDRIGNVTGLLQAMTRSFIGDALADELQLRRTRASALLPLLRGAVATSELARIAAPPIDRWMRHLGARTWELVVTTGLTGRPAEFQMPASLTSRQSVARPVSSSSM